MNTEIFEYLLRKVLDGTIPLDRARDILRTRDHFLQNEAPLRQQYPNQWLGVADGHVIVADSLQELYHRLELFRPDDAFYIDTPPHLLPPQLL